MLMVFIVLAMIATGVSLVLGLLAMSSAGETDREFSGPLMWARLGFQGLTLALLALAVWLR
jgi:Hypoxia induced protein conserved region